MATKSTCACCTSTTNLKQCKGCRVVAYCSTACQKKDWKTHKTMCRFATVDEPEDARSTDPLSLLLAMSKLKITPKAHAPPPTTLIEEEDDANMPVAERTFNIFELRMAIFSRLPALDLLRAAGVCRSWFLTIATERKLQQRLFLAPGPGELVYPAKKDKETILGIQPRDHRQLDHTKMTKVWAMSGGGSIHLMPTISGSTEKVRASVLEANDTPIILNPFLTSLWPQDPANMTLNPYITIPDNSEPAASWRRMQLTSPPMLEADLQIWYSGPRGDNMSQPRTGKVRSGVTLGHLADLLAAQLTESKLHWMQITGYGWWLRSADAVIVPEEIKEAADDETGAEV